MDFCTVIWQPAQSLGRKGIMLTVSLLVMVGLLWIWPGGTRPAHAETAAQYYTYSVSIENRNGKVYLSAATNSPIIGYYDWVALFPSQPGNDLSQGYTCWFWVREKLSETTDCPWQPGLYAVYSGKDYRSEYYGTYVKLAEAGPTGSACD